MRLSMTSQVLALMAVMSPGCSGGAKACPNVVCYTIGAACPSPAGLIAQLIQQQVIELLIHKWSEMEKVYVCN